MRTRPVLLGSLLAILFLGLMGNPHASAQWKKSLRWPTVPLEMQGGPTEGEPAIPSIDGINDFYLNKTTTGDIRVLSKSEELASSAPVTPKVIITPDNRTFLDWRSAKQQTNTQSTRRTNTKTRNTGKTGVGSKTTAPGRTADTNPPVAEKSPTAPTTDAGKSVQSTWQPPVPLWMRNRQPTTRSNVPIIASSTGTIGSSTEMERLPSAEQILSSTSSVRKPIPLPGTAQKLPPKELNPWGKTATVLFSATGEASAVGGKSALPPSVEPPIRKIVKQGEADFQKGRFDSAAVEFGVAAIHYPNLEPVVLRLGLTDLAQGLFPEAGARFNKIFTANPESKTTLLHLVMELYPTPQKFQLHFSRLQNYVKRNPDENCKNLSLVLAKLFPENTETSVKSDS